MHYDKDRNRRNTKSAEQHVSVAKARPFERFTGSCSELREQGRSQDYKYDSRRQTYYKVRFVEERTSKLNDKNHRRKPNSSEMPCRVQSGRPMRSAGLFVLAVSDLNETACSRSLAAARSFEFVPSSRLGAKAHQADRRSRPSGPASRDGRRPHANRRDRRRGCDGSPSAVRSRLGTSLLRLTASCASSRTQREATAAFDHSTTRSSRTARALSRAQPQPPYPRAHN